MDGISVELLERAKAAGSAEELAALAKESGVELTAEEAGRFFTQLHKSGELSDEELDNVAGGGCRKESPAGFKVGERVRVRDGGHQRAGHCRCVNNWAGVIEAIYYTYGDYQHVVKCQDCGVNFSLLADALWYG